MVFSEELLEKEIETAIQGKAYDTAANLINAMSALRCANAQMQNAKNIEKTLMTIQTFIGSIQKTTEQFKPELAKQFLEGNKDLFASMD